MFCTKQWNSERLLSTLAHWSCQCRQQGCSSIVFHSNISSSFKEDVKYCVSPFFCHKMLKKGETTSGLQRSSEWPHSASDTQGWQETALFVFGETALDRYSHQREFSWGLYLQMSGWCPFNRQIQRSFCLRFSGASWMSTKSNKVHNEAKRRRKERDLKVTHVKTPYCSR